MINVSSVPVFKPEVEEGEHTLSRAPWVRYNPLVFLHGLLVMLFDANSHWTEDLTVFLSGDFGFVTASVVCGESTLWQTS